MTTLRPQIWYSNGANDRPRPQRLEPITEPYCGRVKPSGGIWTSSPTDDGGSGWTRWCADEEFAGPQFPLWQLDPDPAANIYTVDTLDDLLELCRRFPPVCDHQGGRLCGSPLRRSSHVVGWRRVAEAYDAVHLTEEGQWATRLSVPADLYGWDCESTLWFRWRFTAVHDLGIRTFERQEVAW